MDTSSLKIHHQHLDRRLVVFVGGKYGANMGQNIHKEILEEGSEFTLGGRISEVPNVESAACRHGVSLGGTNNV
jgi:hypothetical protein